MTTTEALPLSARLDREWVHLSRRAEVVARVRRWELTAEPFNTLDELLVLTGFVCRGQRTAAPMTPARDAAADVVLHRLAVRASEDWLAGRIVLQRILAGLLAIAGAEQRRDPTVDAFGLLVGEAWLAIAAYPDARAPRDVAAKLLNAARQRAFVGPRRRRRVVEVLSPTWRIGEPRLAPDRTPCDELAAIVRTARECGLAAGDLELVRGLVSAGTVTMAGRLSVTPRTVRNRRDRVAATIRELVA